MAVPVKSDCRDTTEEDWLITYSDAVTLLMAFFVMLLTFSEFDIPAFQEAAAAIKNKVGKHDDISPTEKLKIDVEDVVFTLNADQVVQVSKDERGVVIDLASNAFYKPGSADLRDEAIPVLEKIVQTLDAPRYQTFNIRIEGHTDDDPIATERFPSNWELSAGRATRVVRFFVEQGVDAIKLSGTGFAETRPKVPNRDADGNAIKENQSTNRRTAIRVEPMSLDEQDAYFSLLAIRRVEEQKAKREAEAAAEKKDGSENNDGEKIQGEENAPAPGPGTPETGLPGPDAPAQAAQPAG